MKTETLTPPLKWFGGKQYLAKWIISHMPPRCANPNNPQPDDNGYVHYVEPYAGGLAVLFEMDPQGISEVVNDLNYELTNFWACLQEPEAFAEFKRRVDAIPFSQVHYEGSHADVAPTFDKLGGMTALAVNFFVRCRQSRAGMFKDFATLTRNRTRRGMNEQASAWLNAVEGLPAVHARLKRVVILNRPALEVIKQQDGPRTLFYLDPPYLQSTRTAGGYAHEMSVTDHDELLDRLGTGIEGRFLLSGYRSELYDTVAERFGWTRYDLEIDNKAAGGKEKRKMVECLWVNF